MKFEKQTLQTQFHISADRYIILHIFYESLKALNNINKANKLQAKSEFCNCVLNAESFAVVHHYTGFTSWFSSHVIKTLITTETDI